MKLEIKKLDPHAKLPIRSTTFAAGYDIFSLTSGILVAHSKTVVRTGIALRIPRCSDDRFKLYGSIRSRSGLSFRNSIEVGAGVIDEDFNGELQLILYNHGDDDFTYSQHSRLAQLVLEVIATPEVVEVVELNPVESNRLGGFGSTGI